MTNVPQLAVEDLRPRARPGAPVGRPDRLSAILGRALNAVGRVSPRLAGRLARELWRRPFVRGAVLPAERAVHDAARAGTITHAGRRVRTYSWGDGRRPVLLVHGWRSRASRYSGLVSRLVDAGYSPVSYDAPGHGSSGGRAGTILDHELVMKALAERHGPFEGVVAHSLAVPFALYAVRHGLPASRVVAVSGVGRFAYVTEGFATALGLRPEVAGELRRSIERGFFQGDTDIWRRFSADIPADCDVLVIHDTADRVVDPTQSQVITRAYGDRATYVTTTGLGHSRILGSEMVADAVLAFLDAGRRADA